MNNQLAGVLILMAGVAILIAAVRAWPNPGGRHRATAVEVPFVELLPNWPQPVYGAAAAQAFHHCRGCREVRPVVLHPGAHTCDAGHVTLTTTTGGR